MAKRFNFFDWIERVGNKMPHPFLLFLYLTGIVLALSCAMGLGGISVTHPGTGETIAVVNLVSKAGLLGLIQNFISNFQTFAVLGNVLMLGIATGLCEQSGFFTTAIKMSLAGKKGNFVVFVIALIAAVSGGFAGDVAFILIPALAGVIFHGMGRHPLAGVLMAYAAVGGGFTTAIIPGSNDPVLHPVTVSAAQILIPDFDMNMLASWYILAVAGVLITIVVVLVTLYIIEPSLGTYTGGSDSASMEITPEEKRACKWSLIAVLIYLALIIAGCVPANGILRNPETGSLVTGSPLMKNLVFFFVMLFALAGTVYAVGVGKVKKFEEFVKMMEHAIKGLSGFIVLVIAIGQFMYFFNESNIGRVLAIAGGEFLASLPVPTWILVVLFLLLMAFINLFIASASTKWFLLAPMFVPMLMRLNLHPAYIQVIYRLGDCTTNHLTPLIAYFAILLSTAQKYEKDTKMGLLFKVMSQYAIAFYLTYAVLLIVWLLLDIPTGIGGTVFLQ